LRSSFPARRPRAVTTTAPPAPRGSTTSSWRSTTPCASCGRTTSPGRGSRSVSFAGDLPDLSATETRLLRNQTDIGNAVKPYYGAAAGNRLTELLKEHILGAVALLEAANAGDPALIAERRDEWYANGRQVADFLQFPRRFR
jgi:hypothetical protein